MKPLLLAALLFITALCAGPAAAQMRIEGQTFEARSQLAETELRLNGAGLRGMAWLKVYVVGLYIGRKATTPAQVFAVSGPKRLQLRMLQDVPAKEFVKAFNRGVTRNTPEAEMAGLRERMGRFDDVINSVGKVKKGDVVNLDSMPGKGLVFTINGVAHGAPIAGDDFYAALLRIFIGEKPTDEDLKRALLGAAP